MYKRKPTRCEIIVIEGPGKTHPSTSIYGASRATTKHVPSQSRSNSCDIGNIIMYASEQASDASLKMTLVGAALAGGGFATGNRVAMGGGAALAKAGNFVGMGAGALQLVGGIAQYAGGGSGKNAVASVVSLGSSAIISKTLKATMPRGTRWGQEKSQKQNEFTGNVLGTLQALSDWLAPTQVECPR